MDVADVRGRDRVVTVVLRGKKREMQAVLARAGFTAYSEDGQRFAVTPSESFDPSDLRAIESALGAVTNGDGDRVRWQVLKGTDAADQQVVRVQVSAH